MTTATEDGPVRLPAHIWNQEQTRHMLRNRDMMNLLRLAHQHGVSQQRMGSATGITQSHISDIMTGMREVTSLHVLERFADGLAMPDDARMLLGLAPRQAR